MSEDLEALISQAIGYNTSLPNRQFILSYDDGEWMAGIGNPCIHVCLGESRPEVSGEGATPSQAVQDLLVNLATAEKAKNQGWAA